VKSAAIRTGSRFSRASTYFLTTSRIAASSPATGAALWAIVCIETREQKARMASVRI
jgi:hypothetical protein